MNQLLLPFIFPPVVAMMRPKAESSLKPRDLFILTYLY